MMCAAPTEEVLVDLTMRRRRPRGVASLATTSALVAATLVSGASGAMAKTTAPCRVKNMTTLAVYRGSGSNLQVALDAADPGETLQIQGVCVGTFSVVQDVSLS